MRKDSRLCAVLGALTLLAEPGLAQTQPPEKHGAGEQAADKDFGRLSDDGISAFNDIHLARLDMFDGNTDQAAKLVGDALAALHRAKSDGNVFMKAESALHGPSSPGARNQVAAGATPIAWLPIDCEIVMGQTYQSSPENAAAVVDANKSLERGEGKKAVERVRLAAIDVDYVMALAPLDQSIADVERANGLIANHDYYGAGQALRDAEVNVRYDSTEDIAHVRHGGGKAAPAGK